MEKYNVRFVVENLKNTQPILNARRAEGALEVVGEFHDFKSGKVGDVGYASCLWVTAGF